MMNSKKVYAVQIAPEYQVSPLFCNWEIDMGVWPYIEISGNRDFHECISPEFERAKRAADYWGFETAIEEVWNGESDCYNTICDVLNDYLPREQPYTDTEENRVKRIIKAYRNRAISDDEYFLEILSLAHGKRYTKTCIRGCSTYSEQLYKWP